MKNVKFSKAGYPIFCKIKVKHRSYVITEEDIESVYSKLKTKDKYISIMGWDSTLPDKPRPFILKRKKVISIQEEEQRIEQYYNYRKDYK